LPPAPPIGGVGLVPRRPCIEFPCPMLAVPGKARCRIHEAQLQRAKWARNPNRDMGYRRLKRAGGVAGAVRHLRRGDHPLRP
jgi:hypothetical protein